MPKKPTYEMSMQCHLAQQEWQDSREAVTLRVIKGANEALKNRNGKEYADWIPYCCTDGLFDIMDDDGSYIPYTQEEGNAGDDCIFLANVFCLVLIKTGNPDYWPVIRRQLEISVEGL